MMADAAALPVTYYVRSIREPYNMAISAVLALLCCIVYAWFVNFPKTPEYKMALLALAWGIGFFVFLTQLAKIFGRKRPYLQITPEGILHFDHPPLIRWDEITEFFKMDQPFLGAVGLSVFLNGPYIQRTKNDTGKPLNPFVVTTGSPFLIIPKELRTTADELIARLYGYRNIFDPSHPPAPQPTGYAAYGKDYIPERDDK